MDNTLLVCMRDVGETDMTETTDQQLTMVFSDSAAAKVKTLIEEDQNDNLKLRVYITGGGCAGFSYGFTFDEAVADDDTLFENDGVNMVVDPMSYQYLVGSVVDYKEGLQGSQFVIDNPNATTTCGCGSSFSI
ncbi:iron-sulfur cluster insertion protein [Amphritea japonica ATCC BAA-1530]|uniref:Iron-sulfur cluster insertion protein ErpA n=2 Tax=Amphritea TaxID=515417 RepID=A0A7R6PDV8_9GAMM|nr:iron-sulfur cluster insertion protein [Amphritea japonica ATCC BAA-1530]